MDQIRGMGERKVQNDSEVMAWDTETIKMPSTEMGRSEICANIHFWCLYEKEMFCKSLISTLILGSYFHSYLNLRKEIKR